MKTLYKFLRTDLKSNSGNCKWKIGEWKHKDNISICNTGFHASNTPLQALGYVQGEILAEVEVKGKHEAHDDKEVWSDMRIVKAWHWKKENSVSLAIFAAELVIYIYEKKYPNDNRPRKAIQAAKNYLKSPTSKAADAAAGAADAAGAAARAAYAAAYAAGAAAAARAAYAATYAADAADAATYAADAAYAATYAADAADAATYAADAADAATYAAARKKLIAKIDKWFLETIKTLEVYDK